jgi:hypothetical protein
LGFATDAVGAVIDVVACGAFPVIFVIDWAVVGAADETWVCGSAVDDVAQGTGLGGGAPVAHVVEGKAMTDGECGGEVSGNCVEPNEVRHPME